MTEEAGKQEESKSEDKKDPDLTQLQEQVSQVAPLVKPLGANVLELIKSIPFIGASAAGGISFWLQQKLVTSLLYFGIVFFLVYFLLPFYNSAGRRLRHHSDQWGSSFIDGLIARFKREWREISWRYARKDQKFLLVQGENCQYDEMESFGRDLFTPQLKDIFVPLQLALSNQNNLHRRGLVPKSILSVSKFILSVSKLIPFSKFIKQRTWRPSPYNQLQEHQNLQIWRLLRLAKREHTYRRILIKADGGKGKTFLLRYITYSYFDQQLRRGPDSRSPRGPSGLGRVGIRRQQPVDPGLLRVLPVGQEREGWDLGRDPRTVRLPDLRRRSGDRSGLVRCLQSEPDL